MALAADLFPAPLPNGFTHLKATVTGNTQKQLVGAVR